MLMETERRKGCVIAHMLFLFGSYDISIDYPMIPKSKTYFFCFHLIELTLNPFKGRDVRQGEKDRDREDMFISSLPPLAFFLFFFLFFNNLPPPANYSFPLLLNIYLFLDALTSTVNKTNCSRTGHGSRVGGLADTIKPFNRYSKKRTVFLIL